MGFIIWAGCCIGVGVFANNKGRSGFGWGLLSMIISPLVGAIILACMRDLKAEEDVQQVRMEQQQIKDRVVSNEKLTDYRLTRVENDVNRLSEDNINAIKFNSTGQTALIEDGNKECPACGKAIKSEAIKCKHCGVMVNEIAMKECPYCKEYINVTDTKCRHCNSDLVSLDKAGVKNEC